MNDFERFLLVIGFFIGMLIGMVIGDLGRTSCFRHEAIKHHAATWVVDSNGDVTFTWKDKE